MRLDRIYGITRTAERLSMATRPPLAPRPSRRGTLRTRPDRPSTAAAAARKCPYCGAVAATHSILECTANLARRRRRG